MGFEWDPAERAAFDVALATHLLLTFPDARQSWTEYERRLVLTFPDGCTCSLWEPNFFFSFPSFDLPTLFDQAVQGIAQQRADWQA